MNVTFIFSINFVQVPHRKCKVSYAIVTQSMAPAVLLNFTLDALGITTPDYYFYLNQSGCYDVDGLDDKQDFRDTLVS